MIIVLVTRGKHESVDTAAVHLFADRQSADDFCVKTNSGKTKYWNKAEIVRDGESVELMQPDE